MYVYTEQKCLLKQLDISKSEEAVIVLSVIVSGIERDLVRLEKLL